MHSYQTNQYEGMIAETVTMKGHNGDAINAYFARPLGSRPLPRHGGHPPRARLGRVVPASARAASPTTATSPISPEPVLPRRPRHARGRRRQGARAQAGRPDARVARRSRRRHCPPALAALRQRQDRRLRHLLGRPPGVPGRLPAQGLRRGHRLLGRPRGHVQGGADAQPAGGPDRLHQGPGQPGPWPLRQRGPGRPRPSRSTSTRRSCKKHGKNYEFHRYDGAGHGFFYYDRRGLPAGAGAWTAGRRSSRSSSGPSASLSRRRPCAR